MNGIFVLSLLLALCSGHSLARDNTGSEINKDVPGEDPYAYVAYFLNPRSLQKSRNGQGRLISWNWNQMPFKNYLFPKVDAEKEAVTESDGDTDVEHLQAESSAFPVYPFAPYYNTEYHYNGYPYAHHPYIGYPYTHNPYAHNPYYNYPHPKPVKPKSAYPFPSYNYPGFPNQTPYVN